MLICESYYFFFVIESEPELATDYLYFHLIILFDYL